ncbi:MAG: hypothetical protein F6J86_09920 [Symploca sp. SIO1B1]|nr:hypothetical protein [Symploca sp. SIO1B1]
MNKQQLENILNITLEDGSGSNTYKPSSSTWTFSTSFPDLVNTLLGDLNFTNPTFTINTGQTLPSDFQEQFGYPLRTYSPPLAVTTNVGFSGSFTIDSTTKLGKWLKLTAPKTLQVSGPLEFATGLPRLWLKPSSGGEVTISLPGLGSLSIQIQLVALLFDCADTGSPSFLAPNFLNLQTTISGAHSQHQLDINALVPSFQPYTLRFETNTSQLTQLSFADLDSLLQQVQLSTFFGSGFLSTSALSLQELSLGIRTSNQTVSSLSLALGYQGHLTIFQTPAITVNELDGEINITEPFGNSSESSSTVTFTAKTTIQSVPIDFSVNPFTLSFDAALDSDTPVDVTPLVQAVLPISIDVPQFMAQSLMFWANVNQSNYSFSTSLTSNWDILGTGVLHLESLSCAFSYTPQQKSGNVSAILNLGGVGLVVHASARSGVDTTWSFAGGMVTSNTTLSQVSSDLATKFGMASNEFHPLDVVDDLQLTNLTTTFTLGSHKDFSFTCAGDVPNLSIDSFQVDVHLQSSSGSSYSKDFSGELTIKGKTFTVFFEANAQGNASCFIATYEGDETLSIHDLIQDLFPDLLSNISADVSIDLKEVLIAYYKQDSTSQFLVRIGLSTSSIDLSSLPLISDISPDFQVGVNKLYIVFASAVFTPTMLELLNQGLHSHAPSAPPLPTQTVAKGFLILADVKLGTATEQFSLVAASGQATSEQEQALSLVSATDEAVGFSSPSSNCWWYNLNKSIGPLYLSRVGLTWSSAKSEVEVLLDASFMVGILTVSLEGLGFGFTPSTTGFTGTLLLPFGLDVTYHTGPIEISGGLLHTNNEYIGELIIEAEAFNLVAMGAYGTVKSHPSLFIFLMMNDPPLGGPPFFFITGVSAGFGYNSQINLPSKPQDVVSFIFVEGALPQGSGNPFSSSDLSNPDSALTKLGSTVQPSYGEYWVAAGLNFTVFKFVEADVLLTVAFGNDLEIALLGQAIASIPPPEEGKDIPTIAKIEVDLMIRVAPMAEGNDPVFALDAILGTSSYLLSPDCHLTGGLAFYIWSSGDFVITLGGYHPKFQKPQKYPSIPRLGFNWQISGQLSITGGIYFALTPAALMAGESLSATWHSGGIKAWFDASANFIMYWHPFHFDLSVSVSIGVSVSIHILFIHKTISVHVGASLDLWGPPFGGVAHVHMWVVSFSIHFGSSTNSAPALSWNEFKQQFLPHNSTTHQPLICKVKVVGGLIRDDATYGSIINPLQFAIETHTAVPATTVQLVAQTITTVNYTLDGQLPSWTKTLGIPSMDQQNISSNHTLYFEKKESNTFQSYNTQAYQRLNFEAVLSDSPAALWNNSPPNALTDTTLSNTLTGIKLTPKPLTPDQTQSVPLTRLLNATDDIERYEPYLSGVTVSPDASQPVSQVTSTIGTVGATRSTILQYLQDQAMSIRREDQINVSHLSTASDNALLEAPVFKDLG